jgi:hypothetical protein
MERAGFAHFFHSSLSVDARKANLKQDVSSEKHEAGSETSA